MKTTVKHGATLTWWRRPAIWAAMAAVATVAVCVCVAIAVAGDRSPIGVSVDPADDVTTIGGDTENTKPTSKPTSSGNDKSTDGFVQRGGCFVEPRLNELLDMSMDDAVFTVTVQGQQRVGVFLFDGKTMADIYAEYEALCDRAAQLAVLAQEAEKLSADDDLEAIIRKYFDDEDSLRYWHDGKVDVQAINEDGAVAREEYLRCAERWERAREIKAQATPPFEVFVYEGRTGEQWVQRVSDARQRYQALDNLRTMSRLGYDEEKWNALAEVLGEEIRKYGVDGEWDDEAIDAARSESEEIALACEHDYAQAYNAWEEEQKSHPFSSDEVLCDGLTWNEIQQAYDKASARWEIFCTLCEECGTAGAMDASGEKLLADRLRLIVGDEEAEEWLASHEAAGAVYACRQATDEKQDEAKRRLQEAEEAFDQWNDDDRFYGYLRDIGMTVKDDTHVVTATKAQLDGLQDALRSVGAHEWFTLDLVICLAI